MSPCSRLALLSRPRAMSSSSGRMKTTMMVMLSPEPLSLAAEASLAPMLSMSPPLFLFSSRCWKTISVASSGVMVSHRPSQAMMRKSSDPLLMLVVISGSAEM